MTDQWTDRNWGRYRVLVEKPGYKVKELEIAPHRQLSMQRHQHRSEHWYVLNGEIAMTTEWQGSRDRFRIAALSHGYTVGVGVWHQASNLTDETVSIIEIQYGDVCTEEDIERR